VSDKAHHDAKHTSTQGATTIHASKGGGGKWLLGAAAAVVLLGGGYLAWKNYAPSQDNAQMAYNDTYADDNALRAGPLEPDTNVVAESAAADESAAPPAPAARTRRATSRANAVPEATFGITPVSADENEIVVPAPQRPIWASTPSARRLSAMYPTRALERGREGEASLHCTVLNGGTLDCAKVSETPGGFGNAALRVSRTLRHAEQRADGSSAIGTPVNLRVVFRMPEEERRG
jgi:TonB family protein